MTNSVSIRKEFWKYVFLSFIIAAINVMFYNNQFISMFVAFLEILFLTVQLIRGGICRYLTCYIIFMCHCIEFSQFVNETYIYNLKNFRLLGINFGVWLLIPVLVYVIMRPLRFGHLKVEYPIFFKFSKGMLLLNFIAAFIGIILVGVNDNGIQAIGNVEEQYVRVVFSMLFLPLVAILSFYYINTYEEKRRYLFLITFQALIWGCSFQFLISYLFGIYGNYGSVRILASSIMYFILPFSLLIAMNKNYCFYPKTHMIITTIGLTFNLLFNSNGKTILFFGVVAIIWLLYLMKKRTIQSKLIVAILLFAIVFVTPALLVILSENILFKSKFQQAMSLVSFWNSGWLDIMANSPRIRVGEFLNTCIEYLNKPWLMITGKGYLGSIRDYTNMFGNFYISQGAFSSKEWMVGSFFNLHEITSIFLIYGIPGVVYAFRLLKMSLQNYSKNIWLLIGMIWFILLYGYSFTLTIFGVFVYMYGLTLTDINKKGLLTGIDNYKILRKV